MDYSSSRIGPTAHTTSRLFALLKSQIVGGVFPIGSKLPSTRTFAIEQGVSRSTVIAVYEQLAAEGYIETAQGAVARVAEVLGKPRKMLLQTQDRVAKAPRLSTYSRRASQYDLQMPLVEARIEMQVKANRPINFLYGALSWDDFPALAWRRAYDRALFQRQSQLYYASPQGEQDLRIELQGYLRRARGLTCNAEQILIVNGSQQAIDLCARVLLDAGDRVAIEEPCYMKAHQVFEAAGAQMCAVSVDEQGMITRQLPKKNCALAYVTPSHQFPLGGVMPIARRHELLAWAQRSQAWIIEDDYDGEFRYGLRPVDALQSVDDVGCVIYIGTVSKALSPQLRIGYLVLPPSLVSAFIQAKNLADRHTPRLEQAALASLIASGVYERHIRRVRRDNERRRIALQHAIEKYMPFNARIEGAASGLHVVVWITNLLANQEDTLVAKAMQLGVGVRPISPMYALRAKHRSQSCAGLVLGYARLSLDEIRKGIQKLAAVVGCISKD